MIVIGRIMENNGAAYPSIKSMINKPIRNKKAVLDYMKRAKVVAASPAILIDVISNRPINSELLCYSDGKYGWRSDVIYYVDKYDMQLPDEFIDHALRGGARA